MNTLNLFPDCSFGFHLLAVFGGMLCEEGHAFYCLRSSDTSTRYVRTLQKAAVHVQTWKQEKVENSNTIHHRDRCSGNFLINIGDPPGMAVGCCELRLRSTPRYRLVCICFPTPGRGLSYGSGLGLSRCLGPGECLHSFICVAHTEVVS